MAAAADEQAGPATQLGEPDRVAARALWTRFLASVDEPPTTPLPWVGAFGDSVELADELLALVIDGPKRATASAVLEYEIEGEALPVPGDCEVVTDGVGRPRAVLETTEVRVGPLSSVDDQFAWDEGEGDRTREYWLETHTSFFQRLYRALGADFHPDIPVVFSRFEVVHREP